MKKARVTIETLTTHQIYVEQDSERFLYALTTDLGEAIKLKQKAKHEFGIGRQPKTKNE